jgi:DNA-binding LacI/PurR family transcriptional regulator
MEASPVESFQDMSPALQDTIRLLSQIKFDRASPIHRQISKSVGDLIRIGKLSEGTRIPSIQILTKVWDVTLGTINQGLRPLMQEGLLTRKRRVGTIVQKLTRSQCLGIYLTDPWTLERQGSMFFPSTFLLLQEAAADLGWGLRFWLDSRPPAEHGVPMPELVQAIDRQEITGLIVPQACTQEFPWLRQLPIPLAAINGWDGEPLIAHHVQQLYAEFAERFAAKGCKSMGVLLPFGRETSLAEQAQHFECFERSGQKTGLETRREWILAQEAGDHASYAYYQFRRLMALAQRPDALIVFPDTLADGVILSALESGLRVPEDMKFGFHTYQAAAPLCPFEAIWAETSIASVARLLIVFLRDQLEGLVSPVRITLPFRFYEGSALRLTSDSAASAKKSNVS